MAYVFLAIAIASEVFATSMLKASEGFSKWVPVVFVVIGYVLCFTCLGLAMKDIPIGIAYAIWAGVGTAVVAAIGFTVFKEPITWPVILGITLIIAGTVILNVGGTSH